MAPLKIVTLDDMWDQMNRTVMYVLCVTIACFIDFGLIAGSPIKCTGFHESFTREFAEDYCWTQGEIIMILRFLLTTNFEEINNNLSVVTCILRSYYYIDFGIKASPSSDA